LSFPIDSPIFNPSFTSILDLSFLMDSSNLNP
jgi:hypothetical protein